MKFRTSYRVGTCLVTWNLGELHKGAARRTACEVGAQWSNGYKDNDKLSTVFVSLLTPIYFIINKKDKIIMTKSHDFRLCWVKIILNTIDIINTIKHI